MPHSLGIPKEVAEVVNESQSQVLARLTLTGVSNADAATQLGISMFKVRKLQKTEEFKNHLKEAAEDMMGVATNTWRGLMADLIPLAYKALTKALQEGDLKGVEIMMKTMGIDKQVPQTGTGNIQIVLPNYNTEKTVKSEVIDG